MAEQNSYNFWTRYSNLCLKCKVCPLRSVIKHVRGTTLCCPVERIRSEHWQFLLSALSVDNSLTEVYFKSDLPSLEQQQELWKKRRRKKDENYPCPYGYSPENISDICKYTARLLTVSQTLQTLIIENLPITKEDATHLAEGLKSAPLKEFAFRCYPYPHEVIEIVCRGLRESNVSLLDFSSCNINLLSLGYIRNVIMKHKARRTIETFPDTLRYREPVYDEMKGLNRIVLNGNNIKDRGVKMLCEVLYDDNWVKALDLQYCGITNDGAKIILELVTENSTVQVVDVRLNEIAGSIIEQISLRLGANCCGRTLNYIPLPLWKPKSFSLKSSVQKNKLKTKVTKKYSPTKRLTRKNPKRISCEILNTKEINTKDAMVQTEVTDDIKHFKERNRKLELSLLHELSAKESLVELSEKFKFEILKLHQSNATLHEQNVNLRREILRYSSTGKAVVIDHDTYDKITYVFAKFQNFLQLMKDYGLWDLASTIGVTEYEKTKIQTLSNSSKFNFGIPPYSPPEVPPKNGPVKVPLTPKPRRCCSCLKPECISNQKASNLNYTQKIAETKTQIKNVVDKAKVARIFKELRESYTNDDFGKEMPPPPRLTRKRSFVDLSESDKSVPNAKPFSLKDAINKNIPNKFKQLKNRQDLFEAVKNEMEKIECVCQSHKRPHSPEKGSPTVKNQTNVNNESYFKSVSSQTAAVGSLSNYKNQKYNTLTESPSSDYIQKSKNQSTNSYTSFKPSSSDGSLQQRFNSVSQEWDERITNSISEIGNGPRGTAVGAESPNPNLIDSKCFSTKTISKIQEYLTSDPVSGISETKKNKPSSLQGISKSISNNNVNIFSGNFGHYADEQKIKMKPNQTSSAHQSGEQKIKMKSNKISSNIGNSTKSYLESVSDASTDKDVKSLSGSELYESVKSGSISSKGSNKLSKAQKDIRESNDNPIFTNEEKSSQGTLNELCESFKSVSVDSKRSNKSPKAQKAFSKSGGNSVSANAALSNSNSSKSSKRGQKQKKNVKQNASGGGKIPKDNVSGSSVPSLSDITTVSSHSLNTNSIMDQLSESAKCLS